MYERSTKLLSSTLAVTLAMALAVGACTAQDAEPEQRTDAYPSYVQHVFAVSDLQAASADGRAFIDLQVAEYGYYVDPGVDYSTVDLMCPSGRLMTLDAWVNELGFELSSPEAGIVIFSSGAGANAVNKAAPICDGPGCQLEREANGQWACLCSG